jgi:hypothetical protein
MSAPRPAVFRVERAVLPVGRHPADVKGPRRGNDGR